MSDPNILIKSATIEAGESLSGAIDMSAFSINKDNFRLFNIVMPAAWTAANLTFQFSIDDGVTFVDMYDADGNEVTAAADSGRGIVILPEAFSAISHLKIRSGTSASEVIQVEERIIKLVLRHF